MAAPARRRALADVAVALVATACSSTKGNAPTTHRRLRLLTQHLCQVHQDVARWLYPGYGHAEVVAAYEREWGGGWRTGSPAWPRPTRWSQRGPRA